MIVVDTSAVVTIILGESGAADLAGKLERSSAATISPVSYLESVMVLSRSVDDPKFVVDQLVGQLALAVGVVDAAHLDWAIRGFMLFGKGRHPARLNFGDCFSYAAAQALNAPLLFVGNDFTQTDVRVA